ncbi:DUF3237 domain-containing protein [Polymorphobacter megasporae]|uniref:DUF3237 domain-containing protein n=1 Tax=Glacieibacterium megasporae TaxID=2835787 RepID=UPI001C1E5342|nr:DUF3237 domain-containing protein [Polymorphobacter megasporae]UAJ12597.1 DUF3237 domain-containing protein [Polymorphobacter megasporae]
MTASSPAAPSAPHLTTVFSAMIEVGAPIELGVIDGGRERFIPILGGTISGPRLTGIVLCAGGDWQTVRTDGRTELLARYFLKAADGTVIAIENPGMRVAVPEVIDRMALGEEVAAAQYYSGGSPRFRVTDGPHDWLRKRVFMARGVRRPDSLTIEFYTID